jgi:hypothetical protein
MNYIPVAELHIIETFLTPKSSSYQHNSLLGKKSIAFFLYLLDMYVLILKTKLSCIQLVSAHTNYIMGTKDEVILFYCDTGN